MMLPSFCVSQQIAKMVDSLAENLMKVEILKNSKNIKVIKRRDTTNRLKGLEYIRNMHENYPEATVGIETKDAIRSVLNHERNSIKKLRSDGMLEADEAERMIVAVEERMKEVMESHWSSRLPEPGSLTGGQLVKGAS